MIPLGLRLAFSGGREALTRLAILAAAVGIGVGLLLTALAAINAVNAQNHRHAWLWTGTASVPAGHAPAGTDPLWWSISGDEFGGQQMRVTPEQLDGDARAQAWQRITQSQPRYTNYEKKTDRDIPVIRLARAG